VLWGKCGLGTEFQQNLVSGVGDFYSSMHSGLKHVFLSHYVAAIVLDVKDIKMKNPSSLTLRSVPSRRVKDIMKIMKTA